MILFFHVKAKAKGEMMDAKKKAEIIAQGKKKGLRIQRNLFNEGWCVLLPNGATYEAKNERDLLSYIVGY